MSTYTFTREDGSSTPSSYLTFTIKPTEVLRFTRIKAKITNGTTNKVNAYVTITCGSGNSYTSETIEIDRYDTDEPEWNFDFMSVKNTNIVVRIYAPRCTFDTQTLTDAEKMLIGLGASITTASMPICEIDIGLKDGIWGIGSSGWPELIQNPDIGYTGFAKDDDGQPLNPTLWRIDDTNDGFPHILPVAEIKPAMAGVLTNTPNGLVPYVPYINTPNGLVPITKN